MSVSVHRRRLYGRIGIINISLKSYDMYRRTVSGFALSVVLVADQLCVSQKCYM